MEFAIANYVFPTSLRRLPGQPGQDQRLRFTVGVHPKFVQDVRDLVGVCQDLVPLLTHPLCVGLGEVGLDFTSRQHLELQRHTLNTLLPLAAEYGKALVLHCRGEEALTEVLELLQRHELTHLPIHLHCFTGSLSIAQMWMDSCPNLCFGFTSMVTRPANRELIDVVSRIPLSRILFETDSPYLSPAVSKRSPNHPWTLPNTAAAVAMYRNIPLSILLQTANSNAKRIYQL